MGRKARKTDARTPEWAKEQTEFQKNKFPDCKDTFPDCPLEVSIENIPDGCKICPKFKK